LVRRNAGDGSLYYRADKKLWVAQYEGVYRYSKDKDKAKLRQLLNQVGITKPENITVSTLLDQYLEYATPNLKFASVERYREVMRLYMKPALGTAKTSDLTAYQVQQQYSSWIAAGISPNVIYLAHTVLSVAFESGAKWQLVRSNIIRDVDAPKVERKEIEVTPDEVKRILAQASTSPLEAGYILALSAGMRGGEIFALQPAAYDAETGTLAIRWTLVNNGTQIGTPKSKHSYRKIQLCSAARDALNKHLRNLPTDSQWMFPSRTGTNLRYHNFIRFHWRPLLKATSVDYKSFHTCCHYVASTLIGENVPLSAVAR
jgi:integrase